MYFLITDTMKEIDTCKKSYKEQVSQLSREEREKQLKKIEDLFQKAKEYTDNKVQIAVQIYEMASCKYSSSLRIYNSLLYTWYKLVVILNWQIWPN